jgi:hypothetical protein
MLAGLAGGFPALGPKKTACVRILFLLAGLFLNERNIID